MQTPTDSAVAEVFFVVPEDTSVVAENHSHLEGESDATFVVVTHDEHDLVVVDPTPPVGTSVEGNASPIRVDTTPVVAGDDSRGSAPSTTPVVADDTTPVVAGDDSRGPAPSTTPHVADDTTPVVAGAAATANGTKEILKGCIAGNRNFPRPYHNMKKAFDVDSTSTGLLCRKRVYIAANCALKHFRAMTDPKGSGEPMFYEVDLSNCEAIEVPVPARYEERGLDLETFDQWLRPAIGAQYFYTDEDGTSVVAEHKTFDPKEFVACLVRNGDIPMEKKDEVVLLEWRAWVGSTDDTLLTNNNRTAGLALDPPVKQYEYQPPLVDFVLYFRYREPIRIHPNSKGKLAVNKFHSEGYATAFNFPGPRMDGSGPGTMQHQRRAATDGDDPTNPAGKTPVATFFTPIRAPPNQPKNNPKPKAKPKSHKTQPPVVTGSPAQPPSRPDFRDVDQSPFYHNAGPRSSVGVAGSSSSTVPPPRPPSPVVAGSGPSTVPPPRPARDPPGGAPEPPVVAGPPPPPVEPIPGTTPPPPASQHNAGPDQGQNARFGKNWGTANADGGKGGDGWDTRPNTGGGSGSGWWEACTWDDWAGKGWGSHRWHEPRTGHQWTGNQWTPDASQTTWGGPK